MKTFVLLTFILIMLAFGLAGCSETPTVSKTARNIADAKIHVEAQAATLSTLGKEIDSTTAQTFANEKPKMQQLTSDAAGDNKAIGISLGDAAKGAEKDGQTIANLTKEDPNKVLLRRIGIFFLIGGCVICALGLVLASYIPVIAPILRNLGAAAAILGVLFLCIAAFLVAIYWVFAALLVAGAIFVWLHRSEIIPALTSNGRKLESTVSDAIASAKK